MFYDLRQIRRGPPRVCKKTNYSVTSQCNLTHLHYIIIISKQEKGGSVVEAEERCGERSVEDGDR